MSDDNNALINPTRLLFELQNVERLNQSLSGCLEPEAIATKITDSLVAEFNCAFTRIWLVDSDRTELRLVASSGMYTRLDGDFARVPMGAYKVGKIAQHCIPFLSNSLAEESWVKDRQWAIDNNICGFAGLPLAIQDRAIGVLAVFSHQPMAAEFLEALRILCSSVAVSIKNAQLYQNKLTANTSPTLLNKPLSEEISAILPNVPLVLLGTERPLSNSSLKYILLCTAENLKIHHCNYCRLTYKSDRLCLEAMLVLDSQLIKKAQQAFQDISLAVDFTGGKLHIDLAANNIMQVRLFIPYTYQPKIATSLSTREQEVIELLAEGLRDREIAQKLFISDRTVKFHINNVVSKLKARTRIHAIHKAHLRGFLQKMLKY